MHKTKLLFKNKRFTRVFCFAVAIIFTFGIFLYGKITDKGTKVTLAEVKKGNVEQYYETSGVIESGNQSEFDIINGVKVESVNVSLGDNVKKGDLLATFDTSSLDTILSDKEKLYNSALERYNNTLSNETKSAAQLDSLDRQVKIIDAQMTILQTKNSTNNIAQASSSSSKSGLTADKIREILEDSNSTGQTNYTEDEINDIVNSFTSSGSSLSSILNSGSNSMNLTNLQMQKSILETQIGVLQSQDFSVLESTYKSLVDSTKANYEQTKSIVDSLKNGWVAEYPGVVTEINIEKGKVFKNSQTTDNNQNLLNILSGLSSNDTSNIDINSILNQASKSGVTNVGMVIDNYSDYYATFSIGKYDALKVKEKMPVTISSVAGSYKGYVSFISPKATSSSSTLSELAGTSSGTSSLLEAKAKVQNPNDSLIIGFDVKLSIKTDEVKNVLTIPVESLMMDSGNKYVYLYNEKTKTIRKQKIELGISSDSMYEVKTGLKEGNIIVKNPSKDLSDGLKVYS